jgi:peptidoglycan/xylan/chitin deacetylase (PgdA/CDA1 family)
LIGIASKLRGWREASQMASDLAMGCYPKYVYGGTLGLDEIPVFTLHGAEPQSFNLMLEFLSSNGYITLTATELTAFLRGERRATPERAVAITFDDGMGSVFAVAWPLLKKYGMTATVFLVPGRIVDDGINRSNLDDVWASRATLETVTSRDTSEMPFATWHEIVQMQQSGVLEFGSHTLNHTLIFIGPGPFDFVHPRALQSYHFFEFAFAHLYDDGKTGHRLPPLGTPVYASAPGTSPNLRFMDDAFLRHECVDFVARSGGHRFFEERQWKRELRGFVTAYRRRHPDRARIQACYRNQARCLRSASLLPLAMWKPSCRGGIADGRVHQQSLGTGESTLDQSTWRRSVLCQEDGN